MNKTKLSKPEMKKLYHNGEEMVWLKDKLYQICYSQAQRQYYLLFITRKHKQLANR